MHRALYRAEALYRSTGDPAQDMPDETLDALLNDVVGRSQYWNEYRSDDPKTISSMIMTMFGLTQVYSEHSEKNLSTFTIEFTPFYIHLRTLFQMNTNESVSEMFTDVQGRTHNSSILMFQHENNTKKFEISLPEDQTISLFIKSSRSSEFACLISLRFFAYDINGNQMEESQRNVRDDHQVIIIVRKGYQGYEEFGSLYELQSRVNFNTR
jgi:hypothetical protein